VKRGVRESKNRPGVGRVIVGVALSDRRNERKAGPAPTREHRVHDVPHRKQGGNGSAHRQDRQKDAVQNRLSGVSEEQHDSQ